MILRKLTSMAFCVLLVAGSAYGATIKESFEYDDGLAIQGLGGGTGWADGSTWMHPQWTFGAGSNVVGSPSLTYPSVTSVGGKAVFNLATTSAYPMRLMGTTFSDGDTFYIGFIAQKTVASDNTRWFSVALLPNVNVGVLDKAYIGQGSGVATYNAWLGGTTFLDSGVNTQTLAYLLMKVELLSGTEKVTFWVNPDLSQPEDVSTSVGGMSHDTPNDWGSIGAVRIGGSGPASGRPGASHDLDELVISTDSPFVPEPASLLLLTTGAGLMMLRKK
ncbi:MAG: PEP-CTERM sorting domain-containing protein [Phycisphaeraceae bacterium]|nr:PEP-CTERM sorting domain-containing protein [Phycisphaeraceae bacterium]